jgi:plasmid stabilization system protein ParE
VIAVNPSLLTPHALRRLFVPGWQRKVFRLHSDDKSHPHARGRAGSPRIAYYIAIKDGRPLVADKIVDEIIDKCDAYSNVPGEIGTPAPHLGDGYRVFHHKRWVIVFRYRGQDLEVLRIVDGARDYSKLFGDLQ